MTDLPLRCGDGGDFKKWSDASNEGDDFELGDLSTDYERVMYF